MPVARGNVALDLSALSTSLAKRTGADENTSDDAATFIYDLERQNAELKNELQTTTLAFANNGREKDALSEKVEALETQLAAVTKENKALRAKVDDQEMQLETQKRKFQQRGFHNRVLEKLIKGMEEEPNAAWVQEGLRKYKERNPRRRDDVSARSQQTEEGASSESGESDDGGQKTEEGASSASGGSDDGGQDAVPVPPPQPAPPAQPTFFPDAIDEEDLDEPMDAPQGDDVEKVLKDLVCKANEMKRDLEEEGLYSQFEDLYEDVRSADNALKEKRVAAYVGMVNLLEDEIKEAAAELKAQLELNKRLGFGRKGKAPARRC